MDRLPERAFAPNDVLPPPKAASGTIGQALDAEMTLTRERTIALAGQVDEEDRRRLASPYYSPFDWHLGHIGFTEAYWILQQAFRRDRPRPLDALFANVPENPRAHRTALPARSEIVAYLDAIRQEVRQVLQDAPAAPDDPLRRDGYCFYFALQHEWQHQETMTEILALLAAKQNVAPLQSAGEANWIRIPGGSFLMGVDDALVYDNERPAHRVYVPECEIDETPVTSAQFRQFIEDGGYRRQEFWCPAGWEWVRTAPPTGPAHTALPQSAGGAALSVPEAPVCGVSWFEADAYARWAGGRLPTEEEWEKAACWDARTGGVSRYPWGDESPKPQHACYDSRGLGPVGAHPHGRSYCGALDMAGGVWEWTSSVFEPYEGFRAFPYEGYSIPAFDGRHYVLKGGSWATRGPLLRCSFRNFYTPEYRQGFLGFRLARGGRI